MPVRPRLVTTRRTALAGAAAGLGAVTGCDPDRPGDAPSGTAAADAADPDAALVDRALAELRALTALVDGVAAAHPALARPMAALRGLHVAHREALGGATEAPASAGEPPPDPGAALTLVRARERRAQGQLADWAVAARSGALARLLARMSAGTAQQLAVLPARPGGAG